MPQSENVTPLFCASRSAIGLTVGRRLLLSSLMLSCDLIALPDELLLSCVDKSLRTCVMLAGTSKAIRAKLSYEAKARGLRLMCYSAYDIEQHMRGHFHIGALLLTVRAWPFTPPLIVELKQQQRDLHAHRVPEQQRGATLYIGP